VNCPYCEAEMERGRVRSGARNSFIKLNLYDDSGLFVWVGETDNPDWNKKTVFLGYSCVQYYCPKCEKVVINTYKNDTLMTLPQVPCPQCGKKHDFDYTKCPICNYQY